MKGSRACTVGLLLVMAAAGFYSITLNPARFGLYHDDGIYAVTAKALATGQGYRIISLPGEPAQTKYPPVYPFLLSLVWRGWPDYPDNLRFLMLLSVVTAVLFLGISYAYLVRRGYARPGMALLIVALMAFNGRIILHAGGLHAELPYMVLSLAALWLVERYSAEERLDLGLAAGLLLGLVFLTRTIGITLVAAAAAWLLAQRQYKKLLIVLAVSASLILPWLAWQYGHRYPAHTPAWAYYTDYAATFRAYVGDGRQLPGLIAKNLFYVAIIFTPVVSLSLDYEHSKEALFLPAILLGFALITLGFWRRLASKPRLPDIYVALYLGVLLILPYNASIDRYLLPLLPFWLLYMLTQLQSFIPARAPSASVRAPGRLIPVAFALLIGLGFAPVAYRYLDLRGPLKGQQVYRDHAQRERPVLDWIRAHTAPAAVILSYRDPVVYLYTGRHAMNSSFLYTHGFYSEGQPFDASTTRFSPDLIWDIHADYLVLMTSDFIFDFYPDRLRKGIESFIAGSPQIFTLVYEAPQSFARIYRIHHAP